MKRLGITHFNSSKGLKIQCRYFVPPASKANVLCLHGWSDHSRRFTRLAERLVLEGYSVVAPDMPGHGHSEGAKGKVEDYNDWLDITRKAISMMDDEAPLFISLT